MKLVPDELIVTNIQRMCMKDGPGIRTTVFFKGCNLKCPWCCNPENVSSDFQEYEMPDGTMGVYGKKYTNNELLQEILLDEAFFSATNGGVTFSGGEALLQLYKAKNVLNELKARGIHIAVETALMVPEKLLTDIVEYIDYFIVDIKILDDIVCKEILSGNIACYKKNLQILHDKECDILFRLPCCREYTINRQNLDRVCEVMNLFSNSQLEIFALHDLAKRKYDSLGMNMQANQIIEDSGMRDIQKYLSEQIGDRVSICRI